jgi:dehydrogenase/reductase SDR family member 7B
MLKGKAVIITGASSGIGKACAIAFAKAGCNISLGARNTEALKEVAAECEAIGVKTLIIPTDVVVEADCRNLIEKTAEKFGRIDILVNNAGISMRAILEDIELDVLRKVMDVNFWGAVYCTKFALPYLLKSKGSVVGISSIAGFVGLPGRCGYSASKFALNGFLESVRSENLQKDLHVLIAAPGFTASNIRNTALTHDGKTQSESPRDEAKMMPAEVVAEEIVKAVSKRKNTLILTSQGKMTVLMKKIFPGWLAKQVFVHMRKEPGSPF